MRSRVTGAGLGPCGRPTAKVRLGVFSKCAKGCHSPVSALPALSFLEGTPPPPPPPPSEQSQGKQTRGSAESLSLARHIHSLA